MSTPLQEALERVSIVDAWGAAGGGELRHDRGRAFWRDGGDFNVAINKDKGVWHDFVTGEGGNTVGLISVALNLTRSDAARWLIDLAGIEDKPLMRATRLERRKDERDAEEARLFAVAADALAAHCLAVDSVFDPTRSGITELMRDIKRNVLEVFRSYRRDHPALTRALVIAGRRELERREIAAARELREVAVDAA